MRCILLWFFNYVNQKVKHKEIKAKLTLQNATKKKRQYESCSQDSVFE